MSVPQSFITPVLDILLGVSIALTLAALLLGGGTGLGFAGDVALAGMGVVALALLCVVPAPPSQKSLAPLALIIVGLLAALPVAQSAAALIIVDPIGLATHSVTATLAALASLALPLAVFGVVRRLSANQRLVLIRVLLIAIVVCALMGFAQVLQGPNSELRLFEVTNPTEAVGPFANRNHFATLLALGLVLSLPLLAQALSRIDGIKTLFGAQGFPLFMALAFWLTLLVALMLARSRAGLILAIISSAAVVFVVVLTRGGQKSTGRRSVKLSWLWTTAAVASIGAIVLELGLGRVATRFGQDPLEDLRLPLAETVLSLIGTYLPLGSGVGTFAPVYALAERQDTLLSAYANRAHNDWLEFALEGGLVAGVIIVAFGIWYASRLSDAMGSQTPMPQRLMAIAGALGIAVVALHSSVDYPLRTSAIAALFAMCCALMTPVRISESRSSLMFDDGPRPKARPNAYPVEAEQVAAQPVSDWPDAWKPKN